MLHLSSSILYVGSAGACVHTKRTHYSQWLPLTDVCCRRLLCMLRPSLVMQGLVVRDTSVEVSTGAAAAAALAVAAAAAAAAGPGAAPMAVPVAIPARSHLSADGGAGGYMQLAGSAGGHTPLGTSPAMAGPSPGVLSDEVMATGGPNSLMAPVSQAMVGTGVPAAAAVVSAGRPALVVCHYMHSCTCRSLNIARSTVVFRG
jgi:hypothetical protein